MTIEQKLREVALDYARQLPFLPKEENERREHLKALYSNSSTRLNAKLQVTRLKKQVKLTDFR